MAGEGVVLWGKKEGVSRFRPGSAFKKWIGCDTGRGPDFGLFYRLTAVPYS